MASPEIDVSYVAHLARLQLTPEETERFASQLGDILGYVTKLEALDVDDVEPMAHAAPVFDVMREDVARPGEGPDTALANAPEKSSGQFKVPRVVE